MTEVTAVLFATDGTTPLAELTTAFGIGWVDAGLGSSAQFSIPVKDAAALTDRRFVKFHWRGSYRAGLRLTKETRTANESGGILHFEGPGIQAEMLREAVVYPASYADLGLKRRAGEERWFGYMDPGYDDSGWAAVASVTRLVDYSRYPLYPQGLVEVDQRAAWVSTPDGTNYDGKPTWFRSPPTTITSAGTYRLHMASDDTAEWWVDGEPVLQVDGDLHTRDSASTADIYLATGDHIIACKVTNDNVYVGDTVNEIVYSLTTLVDDGSGGFKAGAVISHSGALVKCWVDSDGEPGVTRASVILDLWNEGKTRATTKPNGLNHLTASFTATTDTASVAFTDLAEFSLPIGTMALDEAVAQVAEDTIDFDVDPDTLAMKAWVRRGSNKRTTVAFTIGVNLSEAESMRQTARLNNVLSRLQNGVFVEVADASSQTSYGRIEGGQLLGSTRSVSTATGISNAMISASTVPTSTVSALPVDGAYTTWTIGDTVSVTAHRGGAYTAARVVGVEVDATGDTVRAFPRLVEDRS